jgi:hypothetical protein
MAVLNIGRILGSATRQVSQGVSNSFQDLIDAHGFIPVCF